MMILVTGGSGSGKSAFAEDLLLRYSDADKRIYVATMYNYGDTETTKRIDRHRQMRQDKGFQTVECPYQLDQVSLTQVSLSADSAVLLECLSNLVANEIFMKQCPNVVDTVLQAIDAMQVQTLVIVTNELFSDGVTYDPQTTAYLQALAQLNQQLAQRADAVYEVVYGIPIAIKGAQHEVMDA